MFQMKEMERTIQNSQVLLIEDHEDIANLVSMHLKDLGISVETAADGATGLAVASTRKFDLIILDLMLPKLDGLEICNQLRTQEIYVPILMLTAKTSEMDRVIGLESGADDYLTKPFGVRELVARVKALLRRVDALSKTANADSRAPLTIGALRIDTDRHLVFRNEESIDLTAKEFELLWFFASQPGRVFTRSQLLDSVWGYGHDGYEHTVNSHINRLRSKIEIDPTKPEFILTVWGVGYKFK
ncbi:MAG: response regulator transcription factor, partial [Gammaproteobacteria bacterium]|nr:response regulator transcription factor [Gammaproteobacteria bacterium]